MRGQKYIKKLFQVKSILFEFINICKQGLSSIEQSQAAEETFKVSNIFKR